MEKNTGTDTAELIEAKETYLFQRKTTTHTINPKINIFGAIPMSTPAEVATPFPPLNFKNIVQSCPTMATKPNVIL